MMVTQQNQHNLGSGFPPVHISSLPWTHQVTLGNLLPFGLSPSICSMGRILVYKAGIKATSRSILQPWKAPWEHEALNRMCKNCTLHPEMVRSSSVKLLEEVTSYDGLVERRVNLPSSTLISDYLLLWLWATWSQPTYEANWSCCLRWQICGGQIPSLPACLHCSSSSIDWKIKGGTENNLPNSWQRNWNSKSILKIEEWPSKG